ncbi:glutamine--fructose-6-phosphate transaminase (isomerizing) [Peptoniphilus equinus]|uniref:Glutamine--fructose-6-phosphate aminotransferase [isomerizing] n=1 Tax=Peptoniphilus equinus TaxID=3016343 RepID=A0ABY7QVB6_9FIRM|nr:glutamine--fructose-6-phosphate transaminase (isomerizing) [Peptoniphilus equinus]WBW50737.1 glutamine--fructose-6-phosphate transaminase (isomerizing) [Peptoniphilus equinus]
MCGIVGYCGSGDATEIILNGLEKLEYRGYDSAGISIILDDRLATKKRAGRLKNLENAVAENPFTGMVGIGHTRWATHGVPTEINAHPHTNREGTIAVVHNGIIENYKELKERLQMDGYAFVSETDTEVVAHLLDFYYKESNNNLLTAIVRTSKDLEGSYAICAVALNSPDELVALRHRSPLLLGITDGGAILASDAASIVEHTPKVIYLDDGEIVHLQKNKAPVIYTTNLDVVEKEVKLLDTDVEKASKEGFDHFMLKEIFEQSESTQNVLNRFIKGDSFDLGESTFSAQEFKNFDSVYLSSCGTAFHAAQVAKYLIEDLIQIPVRDEIASELAYSNPFITEKTLLIVVSQSGETADTLNAMRLAKSKGATIFAVTNVVGSTIAREADRVLYCQAGPEISVASTKAYTSQLMNLYFFILDWAKKLGKLDNSLETQLLSDLKQIPNHIESLLDTVTGYRELAENFIHCESVYFIGRAVDYISAKEGSLKLKEISYIHSEALPAGELKHGTIALIEPGTQVIALATQRPLIEKIASNIVELSSRGAEILSVGFEHKGLKESSDRFIAIPETSDYVAPILSIIPLQTLAYYVAVLKGNDVDKPRNLAKSVTVE